MTLKLGVVLIADSVTNDVVRRLSRQVPGNHFKNLAWRPHLSLLHVDIENSRLRKVIAAFNAIELPGHYLEADAYEVLHLQSGWHFLEVRKTQDLLRLQENVLSLAALRKHGTTFTWRKQASPAQVRSYEEYGYANVGEAWTTHFTFAHSAARARSRRHNVTHGVLFKLLALVVMGAHATVKHVVETRPL